MQRDNNSPFRGPTNRQAEITARTYLANPALIAQALRDKKWDELADLAEFAAKDAPESLIGHDNGLYRTLRKQITEYRIAGWGNLNPTKLRELAAADAAQNYPEKTIPSTRD